MSNYRAVLKRVGTVLITIGIFDSAYLIYRISQGQSYLSSLNLYAILAGVFLLRGNLRAVPVITWITAFALSSWVSAGLIVVPFLKPAELWITEFRLYPVNLSLSLLTGIATATLLFWVYTQLRSPSVISATLTSGYSVFPPKLAFILGITLAVLMAGIAHWTLKGAAAAKAMDIAQTQYGSGYKYHVTAMRWEGGQVKASLIAYNQQEIKPVQVEWRQ